MNKINVLILLSLGSLVQACDDGVREVPTRPGHVGRTFVVDRDSELGGIMQSMNDREAQDQLDTLRRLAQETSLVKAIGKCDKAVKDLNEAMKTRKDIDPNWLSRVSEFTQRNCKKLRLDLESQNNK